MSELAFSCREDKPTPTPKHIQSCSKTMCLGVVLLLEVQYFRLLARHQCLHATQQNQARQQWQLMWQTEGHLIIIYYFIIKVQCSINTVYINTHIHSSMSSIVIKHFIIIIIINKKVQQSWQTSALAMHLHPARLVTMPVIFCLLPSSSIVILVFYLFSTGISEQHAWELWVWIQSWVHWFDASSSGNPNE